MIKGRLPAQASRVRTVAAAAADATATAMTKDDTANNLAAIFKVESLLACFAGIDVVIFVASQLLITPELFAQFQATFSTTILMISSNINSSNNSNHADGAVLSLLPTSQLPSSTIPFDAIATPIERVGLVFLMLGMVRIHGSINHKDKGAAEVALWSWIVELAFLLRQYARLDAVIENRLQQQQQRQHQYDLVDGVASLAWCAQVAVVASMILVVLMLTWSYRQYRRAFVSSCCGSGEETTTTLGRVRRSSATAALPPPPPPVCSPTTRLLRHVGWMASFSPSYSQPSKR